MSESPACGSRTFHGRRKKWFRPPHLLVYTLKLKGPLDVVEELALVKAVVVRTVALCMIGGRQHCHLVAVDGVQLEEQLHFLCNLLIGSIFIVHDYTMHKNGENFFCWHIGLRSYI